MPDLDPLAIDLLSNKTANLHNEESPFQTLQIGTDTNDNGARDGVVDVLAYTDDEVAGGVVMIPTDPADIPLLFDYLQSKDEEVVNEVLPQSHEVAKSQ